MARTASIEVVAGMEQAFVLDRAPVEACAAARTLRPYLDHVIPLYVKAIGDLLIPSASSDGCAASRLSSAAHAAANARSVDLAGCLWKYYFVHYAKALRNRGRVPIIAIIFEKRPERSLRAFSRDSGSKGSSEGLLPQHRVETF